MTNAKVLEIFQTWAGDLTFKHLRFSASTSLSTQRSNTIWHRDLI